MFVVVLLLPLCVIATILVVIVMVLCRFLLYLPKAVSLDRMVGNAIL